MVIIRHRIINFILKEGHSAMCIWPFIFTRIETDILGNNDIYNHERIHARQQLEMFWLFFFIWYGIEYLLRFILSRNHFKAYRAISLEKEAYENESDHEYPDKRKSYAWFGYLWNRTC